MWSNFECHKWVIKKSKKPGNVGDLIIFTTSQNCDKIQLVFSCDKKSLAIWNDIFSHSSIRLWLKVLLSHNCQYLHFFMAWPPLWCKNFLVWYGLVKPVSSMYTIQQINSVSNWTSKQQKAWLPVPCIIWPAWCKLDRKSTRLNSSHVKRSRMPSSAWKKKKKKKKNSNIRKIT